MYYLVTTPRKEQVTLILTTTKAHEVYSCVSLCSADYCTWRETLPKEIQTMELTQHVVSFYVNGGIKLIIVIVPTLTGQDTLLLT